jgi:hypothetical protein
MNPVHDFIKGTYYLHVPNYSMLTADLHEMVRKDFVWDRDKWTKDYDAKLEALKQGIMSSATLHFPDYMPPTKLAEVLFYKNMSTA